MVMADLHVVGEFAFQQLLFRHIVLFGPLLALLEYGIEVVQCADVERNAFVSDQHIVLWVCSSLLGTYSSHKVRVP